MSPDQIERLVGRFERSIATHNGPLETIDFGGLLRTIVQDTGRPPEETQLDVAVRLGGLPVDVDPEFVARAAEEALNDADVLLWGDARLLRYGKPHGPFVVVGE